MAFVSLPMPPDDKPLRLKPIDELTVLPEEPVIRLEKPESTPELKPIRLEIATEAPSQNHRLNVPSREEAERRTHQPGIEAIIEPPTANPTSDQVEQTWGEQSTQRHPVPWGWFVLIALILASAILWSLSRVEQADQLASQIRMETTTTLVDIAEEEAEAQDLISRLDTAIRQFVAVDSVEKLAAMARHPERVRPLMEDYYSRHPLDGSPVSQIQSLEPLTLEGRGNFWMASVTKENGKKQSLLIELQENGEPRIDWETTVCYQPMTWDDYVQQRPSGSTLDFRVYVDPDNFYSHEFANPEQWICYRLTARSSEEPLFGYVRKDSQEAATLAGWFAQQGGRQLSLILRLTIPEGLQSRRGVVIEKILSPRWVYMDNPGTSP